MKKTKVKTSKTKEVVNKKGKVINKVVDNKLATTPQYRETLKFNSWCRAFLDKKSSAYGNATEAAIQTYNTQSRHNASGIGHDNLKKLNHLGKMIMESEGLDYKELMKIGLAKMLKEDYDTWEKFMTRIGYFEATPQQPVLNQFNINLSEAIAESRKARGLDK